MIRIEYEIKINKEGKEVNLKVDGKTYGEEWIFEDDEIYCKESISSKLDNEGCYTDNFIELFEELENDIDSADEIIQEMEELLE